MTEYDNSNKGALFTNDRKTNPGQPDFTGNIVLSKDLILFMTKEISAGREPKIAIKGWRKQSKAGKNFVSLAAEEPWDASKAAPRPAPQRQEPTYDLNDDIPF